MQYELTADPILQGLIVWSDDITLAMVAPATRS